MYQTYVYLYVGKFGIDIKPQSIYRLVNLI